MENRKIERERDREGRKRKRKNVWKRKRERERREKNDRENGQPRRKKKAHGRAHTRAAKAETTQRGIAPLTGKRRGHTRIRTTDRVRLMVSVSRLGCCWMEMARWWLRERGGQGRVGGGGRERE